jgi:glyoxylase-like metal-dependent hydrolase (beta-lactamase superfamily II)
MATVNILFEGYLGRPDHRVAPTVSLIQDNNAVVVIDPGMLPSPAAILGPMAALGLSPEDVTDVVFSHHHPDHTINAALFPDAAFHDHWAVYRHDVWDERDAEGTKISSNITLMRVPGHSHEDIATLASTEDGLIVFTHAWWTSSGPADDPYAPDRNILRQSRARILALNPLLIVPGHGPAFEPNRNTPL